MANVSFKFGKYAGLTNQKYQAGQLYITSDEKGLYFDMPETEEGKSGAVATHRIKIAGDIIIKNSVKDTIPPYNINSLYYFIGDNVLAYYTGDGTSNKWKILNDPAVVDAVVEEVNNLKSSLSTANGNIATNAQGIAENKAAIETNAKAIETNAKVIATKAEQTEVDTLKNSVSDLTKKHAEDVDSLTSKIDAAQKQADKGVEDAKTANDAISTLQNTVTDGLAERYTKAAADAAIATAKGEAITAANAYTDKEISGVNDTITNLKNEIGNLSNIMNFRGAATTTDGVHFTVTDGKGDFKLGDVVVVTSGQFSGREYVCTQEGTAGASGTAKFEEIGYTGAAMEGLANLTETVTNLTNTVETNKTTAANDLSLAKKELEGKIDKKVDTDAYSAQIDALKQADTNLQSAINAAATKTELANVQSELNTAIDKKADQTAHEALANRVTKNEGAISAIPNQITNAIDSALAWGTF